MDAKILMGCLGGLLLALGGGHGISEENGPAYRENLTTLSGRTYHRVRLVKVDPNGLLFRHRDGIAKVTFDNLEPDFREFYGYTEEDGRVFENHYSGKSKPSKKEAPAEVAYPGDDEVVILTFRIRTTIPVQTISLFAGARAACGGVPWRSHWARFHPGLAYAHFPCRQLAERDFLISSGIVPAPPGVSVYRLPRR